MTKTEESLTRTQAFLNKLSQKLMDEELWFAIGESALKILAILIISGLLIRVGKVAIQNFFKMKTRGPIKVSERREMTLMKLLENVLKYVVYFIAIMSILAALTIDVKAMLAGAGIVGLAVGFGAQSLVKDIITGFFIIFEDQFSVGDYVRIGQFEGTVEEIGLRTTKIKSFTGEINILPNGSIIEVTNFSVYNSVSVLDIGIAYEGDIEYAEKVLQDYLETTTEKYPELVKTPELLGVQQFGASEVVMRIVAETLPMKHWYIGRQLRKDIKLLLDQHGIEIPFPRMVMYSRQEGGEQKEFGK
ncbi:MULTISPECIES: mechanosensitive ion channel family protein [Bacillaceae]|uniref:mechanosensitive ion channel family protein n=1 Tax=Bacillaceae TaxID=186817 RepID=UPI0017849B3A|nr:MULTISPECIES: mechanosensitive ion channel family protein [Bacillaceae]MBT2641062.1 mechanosensitive ion channel family protein [Bacillus sp. ISL-41]MCM3574888.1 mechanosensitive ion channel family protein [Mesobacillus subterraneus]UYZ22060.1 mechanosensitive ion channel family protein [Mesobacillus jeotgali]